MLNPLFASIRADWEKGAISDLNALTQAESLIRSRSQVFTFLKAEGAQGISQTTLCSMIHGGVNVEANALLKSIAALDVPPAVQAELAQIRVSGMVSAAHEDDAKTILQISEKTQALETKALAEFRAGKHKMLSPSPCPVP